LMLETCRGL